MTASKKKTSSNDAPQPFFTLGLIGTLLVASIASGLGTYYYMKPEPKASPHSKNPNVFKLKAHSKDKFRPHTFTPVQTYQERFVFPYIRKNQNPIKDCYFGYKGKFTVNPKGYKVVLIFKVPQSGKISDLGLVQNRTTLAVKPILECILKNAHKWQFKPHKMKPFKMRFPFFFR